MVSHIIRIHWCTIYDTEDWRIPNRLYYISVILWYIRIIEKVVHIDAISSITIECIVTAPAGLIYVIYLWQQHQMSFGLNMSSFWLLFSGAITAIPLILFSAGAKRIPLSLIGFIQYVGPTIMFVLGIFVFKEPFSLDQLITFIFIWTGIVLYSLSQYIKLKKHPVAKTL